MSDQDDRPPVPAIERLGSRGTVLWNRVTETWDLKPDELELLSAACRTVDHIAAMEKELEGQPLTVLGSQRQPVINPLVSELRFYRAALASHLRALRIPDSEDEGAEVLPMDRKMTRSESGRVAAHARWSR
ncbi:hypothetical protein J4573_52920 [Actinomadura barringtoniae]|uniref:P27 family phage terminase small subunit n=1 Tax=Actinomadura barringtoniae TaxID=1427535 RepID=A0A939PMT9_9ACTN|nr:hypothetical protein [Actinomadura barringtoniae]MBO2455862.1 hypothetical protein [Actinomadura barringtoniae]